MSNITKQIESGNGTATNGRLLPQHLADLERSGLTAETIDRCGFYSVHDPSTVQHLLNWKLYRGELGHCLAIPFKDADGKTTGYVRLKPSSPRTKDGKSVKYESPKGSSNHAFFPPETLAALTNPSTPLVIVEGEKKAARADQDRFPAIGLVGVYGWMKKRQRDENGKGKGMRELIPDLAAIAWQGRLVFLVFDSDSATNTDVQGAERHLAETLARHGAKLKIVRLPQDGNSKVGLDDFLVTHGPDAFRELMAEAEDPKPAKRLPQAAMLLEIAQAAELFHHGEDPYATCLVANHAETFPVRSRAFRRWLAGRYFAATGKAPGGQALQDALNALEGKAVFTGPEKQVSIRLADAAGAIWLDLADADWRAVEITAAGWKVLEKPDVRFRRPRGLLPLPEPEEGGAVEELRGYINVPAESDWRLLVAWLLAALRPKGPYPILVLHGEQGSAKSSTARILRALIDPNKAAIRPEPRDVRDLMIAANNGWVIALDNLSYLPPWVSDALCRLSTGGGFGTRELYSDNEEILFDSQRPVISNGIEEFASRGDLLDRAIILHLPAIPEERFLSEAELWKGFELARPRILGALLDAVAAALRNLPSVKVGRLPRMADFAVWSIAAENALGWPAGSFLEAYTGNRSEANELALEGSPLAAHLRTLAATDWQGTCTDLLTKLGELAGTEATRGRSWPKTPKALGGTLRRLAPNLRRAGITVETWREGKGRTRMVRLGTDRK